MHTGYVVCTSRWTGAFSVCFLGEGGGGRGREVSRHRVWVSVGRVFPSEARLFHPRTQVLMENIVVFCT